MTNLTPTEERILDLLPAVETNALSYSGIADSLDCSESTARDHVSALVRSSVGIDVIESPAGKKYFYKSGGVEHPTNDNPTFQEKTRNKNLKSQEITDHFTELEQRLRRALDASEPAVADGGHPSRDNHEDVVIHRTDTHVGDKLTDEFGNLVFDSEIAARREREVTDRVFEYLDRQEDAGYQYDTAHLLMGGDHVTGEDTYSHQQAEIKETLDDQVDIAYEIYIEHIQRLSERFPAVQVVCQPGNHGALEGKYSDGANADRLLYMMLDKSVRMSGMENVTFIRNDSTRFTNFYVRTDREAYESEVDPDGWKFHLRHGDDSLEHIGTSAGKRRWYNWMLRHEYDQGYRGHYHKFEVDTVHGDTNVIMTGSVKPPDDFEEAIAEWSAPTATVHGVSDNETLTWFKPIMFDL